jgi:heat shock protein HslJ
MPDTMATLEFDDSGKLNGSGGCNEFSAKYEIQGSNLVITDIVSTLVASCMDDRVASQEMQFYNALAGTSGYEISGDKLTIFYDNGQNQLNFTKQ